MEKITSSGARSIIRNRKSWHAVFRGGNRISIFFQRRIAQAIEYRARRGLNPRLCRLVWSASDGFPGVVVDHYGDHLALQTLTLAMDERKDLIVRALEASFST